MITKALTCDDLPAPPPGKSGWPWTEHSVLLPPRMPDGSEWPRISIVTPSYNQGQFIEETIRSVLLQGYPNLEYIVIDGGSTDNSVEIIKKYELFLDYWISEKDRGQSHAINKGFKLSTGEIIAFLNSDDLYMPITLYTIIQCFLKNTAASFICGQTKFIDENSRHTKGFEKLFQVELNTFTMTETCHIAQPSTFFRRLVLEEIGYFNENLHYSFDYELWLRAYLLNYNFISVSDILSQFRLHDSSKTISAYQQGKFEKDFIDIYQKLLAKRNLSTLQRKGLRRGLGAAAALLFVHTETTSTTRDAQIKLLEVIWKTPEVLLTKTIIPTILAGFSPKFIRKAWRSLKQYITPKVI